MNRTLTQNINRGREAIDLARHQGHDTAQWELSLAELERQEMLAWASELADQKLILATEICFAETPLRPITITEVSKYAVAHLMFIAKSSLEFFSFNRLPNKNLLKELPLPLQKNL